LGWGANQAGQLGDNTLVDRASAATVKGGFDAATVAAGAAHTCAVASGGALLCWGRGGSGQLGPRRAVDTPTPVEVTLDGAARGVAAGDAHTCAVLTDGRVQCWGANADGQTGEGDTVDHATPAFVAAPAGATDASLGAIDAVTAGQAHTCARGTAGGLWCWGRNDHGQLGDGSTTSRASPVSVTLGLDPGARVAAASAGDAHTCAVDGRGAPWCWGRGDDGRLGTGGTDDARRPAPAASSNVTGATAIAAGGAHTCALGAAGTVTCWGANDQGQLGVDGAAPSAPAAVPGLDRVVRLAAGDAHTCALRDDGHVWCWGGNTSGQLGDDDALLQLTPQLARLSCR
jgi:alpha-tubulin suppressor-like RCC1 family protein